MEETFRSQKQRSKVTKYYITYSRRYTRQIKAIHQKLRLYYKSTPIKFNKDLKSKLKLLKVFPEMYQFSNNSHKRKVPLLYGYYLTYTIKNNNIIYISEILNSRKSN